MKNELERLRGALARQTAPATDRPRDAAVLVPLVETAEGYALLYEVRSATLRRQPGEVCFPGGGIEGAETPREAALRETWEELAIPPEAVTLLGTLPLAEHSSRRRVYPVVGAVSQAAVEEARPSPAEVGRIFTVPVDWLLANPPSRTSFTLAPEHLEGQPPAAQRFLKDYRLRQEALYWPWDGETIWGLTARITWQLLTCWADVFHSL
ncbi:MAG: CoA pyrophosphatase [Clostridiales bacterium]|nr:CoA pyrophosphatase [Clostridiales bacterium]